MNTKLSELIAALPETSADSEIGAPHRKSSFRQFSRILRSNPFPFDPCIGFGLPGNCQCKLHWDISHSGCGISFRMRTHRSAGAWKRICALRSKRFIV